jgi:uncharacterized phage-associated protein
MPTEQANSAPYDARAVANFLLDLAEERNVQLTQMQLLKLVYFAGGWYLAAQGKPLIRQDFQAWEFGPVVKVVRDAFREFGKSPIRGRAERMDILTGEFVPVEPVACDQDRQFIRTVFDAYHHYDGWELSEITHEEGSPWDEIWNSEVPLGRLGLKISNEAIRKHFVELAARRTN